MKKKKSPLLMLTLGLLILCSISVYSVFAHPGRTDANGGHWDRQSGTYHFHTGEYAGRSSSGSSSRSTKKSFKPPYQPPTENPYKKESVSKKSKPSVGSIIGIIFLSVYFGFAFLPLFISIFFLIYDGFIKKILPKYKINALDEKINELCLCRKELYELETLNFQIPDCYEIGEDGLPRDKQSGKKWGKSFTLYQKTNSGKLHTLYGCSNAKTPKHIYSFYNYSNFTSRLCYRCSRGYIPPDLTWYENYLKFQNKTSTMRTIKTKIINTQKEIESIHKKCRSPIFKFMLLFGRKNKSAWENVDKKYMLYKLIQ